MKKYIYNELSDQQIDQLCQRPKMDFQSVFGKVEPIFQKVEQEGDAGIQYFTEKFDGITPDPLAINPHKANVTLGSEIKKAIDTAYENIHRFHKAQLPMPPLEVETMPGVRCKRVARPIENVGLYVPGGTAILPSTLMMLGIPATLAGCKNIIIATPPRPGGIADEIIYIAQKIGGSHLIKAGGAQAIAGMAFGTKTIPKVDKIFGPGNQYVTGAKMMLQTSEVKVAIDMPAGPSEVLVIADETAHPEFVAADLLSQAEHGPDSQVVLVATGDFNFEACHKALDKQLKQLPRKEEANKSLENSFCIMVDNLPEAFEFSNRYAPEHLLVQCDEANQWQDEINNAGSVFFGHWSPESAGDYASGTNHTLPTYGYARMFSGVSVESFMKQITMQNISKEGLQNLGPTVEKLAELEELQAHKNAVSIRLKNQE